MKHLHTEHHKVLNALIAGTTLFTSTATLACSADTPYIGSVCVTAGTYCPRGYLEAKGQLLLISDFTSLYAVIGTYFGGNGTTNFQLPDLRGRTPVGQGQGIGLSDVVFGYPRGSEQVTLTVNQLPSHTHAASLTDVSSSLQASQGSADSAGPTTESYLASVTVPRGSTPPDLYTADDSDLISIKGLELEGAQITVDNTGAGSPVQTVPPQLGMRYCIASDGIYPPRPD